MVTKQESVEGYIRRLGLKYTHYYTKSINKDPLYSTGNSTQYLVITYNGRECKKICTLIYGEGHGNPLNNSCLGNPMDRAA